MERLFKFLAYLLVSLFLLRSAAYAQPRTRAVGTAQSSWIIGYGEDNPCTMVNSAGTLYLTAGLRVPSGTINFSGATISTSGTITSVDINGGTIDGATIGGSSAAPVTCTTLTASGAAAFQSIAQTTGTFTALGDAVLGTGNDDIYLGTSGDTTIIAGNVSLTDTQWSVSAAGAANFVSVGAGTPGTGAFTTLSSTGAGSFATVASASINTAGGFIYGGATLGCSAAGSAGHFLTSGGTGAPLWKTATQVDAILGANGAGTVEVVSGLTVAEYGNAAGHLTVLTLTAVSVPVTRNAGDSSGYGYLKLYTLPEGIIVADAAWAYVSVDVSQESNISDTGSGDFAVGVAGTTDVTLVGDDARFAGSWGLTDPFVAGIGTGAKGKVAADFSVALDGHTTAIPVYFNIAFDAGDVITGNTTCLVTATITIRWTKMLDY